MTFVHMKKVHYPSFDIGHPIRPPSPPTLPKPLSRARSKPRKYLRAIWTELYVSGMVQFHTLAGIPEQKQIPSWV